MPRLSPDNSHFFVIVLAMRAPTDADLTGFAAAHGKLFAFHRVQTVSPWQLMANLIEEQKVRMSLYIRVDLFTLNMGLSDE